MDAVQMPLAVNLLSAFDVFPDFLKPRFHLYTDNPVEKIFWGRLPVINATAQFYFTKESLMQRLMHQFKYRGQTNLGLFLGQLMGRALTNTTRFSNMDMLVPLPLFAAKEKKRGFNQATILCDGMARILGKPVHSNIIKRTTHTETQTKKTRLERWQNMEGRFELLIRKNEEAPPPRRSDEIRIPSLFSFLIIKTWVTDPVVVNTVSK